jgi:hypothetical protein
VIRLVTVALLLAFALTWPHMARHWALYLVSGQGTAQQARLFLDPFPDQVACELRVRDLEGKGSQGLCRSSLSLEWGSSFDRALASDFSRANVFLYEKLCSRGAPT